MSALELGSLRLPDGRRVEYAVGGDPAGRPLLLQPGTPASRLQARHVVAASSAAGVRLVAISRPGYGGSGPAPPGLLQVGRDALLVAEHLGIGTFSTVGVAGGGPFALATAAAGAERVRAAGVLAGIGPWPEVDQPSPQDASQRRWLRRAAGGDLDGAVDGFRTDAALAFDEMLVLEDGPMVEEYLAGTPPEDPGLFDETSRGWWAADLREALATYDGFVRDNLSWGLPWDFDVRAVRCPTYLWYGELDRMVPAAHGRWLAERIPDARLLVLAGQGHGRTTFGHWPEVVRTLTRPRSGR
jgi:pimeloyl-ACP methyl ester carboxylesterase